MYLLAHSKEPQTYKLLPHQPLSALRVDEMGGNLNCKTVCFICITVLTLI